MDVHSTAFLSPCNTFFYYFISSAYFLVKNVIFVIIKAILTITVYFSLK